MSFIVEDVQFLNLSLGETIPTDYLLDNLGDKINATIYIRFDGDYVIATSTTPNDGEVVIVGNPDSNLSGVIRDNRHLWTDDPIGFEDVKEGDEITIDDRIGGVTVKTVIEKIDSQLLLMDSSYGGSATVYPVNSVAYVSTPMQAIEYFFGLIGNDEQPNYESKTDGNERRSKATGLSNSTLTDTPMIQLGAKSNQYGDLSIKGNGIGDGPVAPMVSQAFIITHNFILDPLSLADEVDDAKDGVVPELFKDTNTLKYVFRAEMSKDLTDPNRKKEVIDFEKLGNCGYLGENFNTGLTNYTIEDVIYRRADLTINGGIEVVTDETTIEFNLINTIDAPFSDGNTKLVFNHWFMPKDESLYREPQFATGVNEAKNRTIIENFLFDRIECTLGALSTNPQNLGTDQQIIKECLFTYVSNSTASGLVTLAMSPAAVSKLLAVSDRNNAISISTKNHALDRAVSDKVTMPVDIREYYIDLTDPDMITTELSFIDHVGVSVDTDTKHTLTIRTEDDVTGVAKFVLNRNDVAGFDRANSEVGFRNITAQVIARKDANTYFVLDEFPRDLRVRNTRDIAPSTSVPTNAIEQDLGFRTPQDDLRKNFVLQPRRDLDIGDGNFNYEVTYPFIFRCEPWMPLQGVNDVFYDESLPNNGLNHDWARYFDGSVESGWDMYLRFSITAVKDGVTLAPYVTESLLTTEDYTDGTEWDTEEAKGYLVSTGDEITMGGQSGISLDENSEIRANMTYIAGTPPTLPDLVMVIMINVFEKEDYKGQYRYYTKYANLLSNNVWAGLSGADTADKSNPSGNIFRVTAQLRASLLTKDSSFRISWRFYDTRPDDGIPDGLITETGVLIITEGTETIINQE